MVTTKEYMKEYRKTHPEYREKQKAYNKRWKKEHPNEVKEEKKRYRQNHPTVYDSDYQKKWRKEHPNYLKDWKEENIGTFKEYRKKWAQEHPASRAHHKLYLFIYKHPELYPLADACELCPENPETQDLMHHHPDYDYPEIYVTCCKICHVWIHKKKIGT